MPIRSAFLLRLHHFPQLWQDGFVVFDERRQPPRFRRHRENGLFEVQIDWELRDQIEREEIFRRFDRWDCLSARGY